MIISREALLRAVASAMLQHPGDAEAAIAAAAQATGQHVEAVREVLAAAEGVQA